MTETRRNQPTCANAWAETKAAVRDYARNPCRATEQKVETAMVLIRDLEANREASPKPKPRRSDAT